jgi:hypothetical protein
VLDRRRSLSPAGGVPHQAHEGPALVLGEVREESNQISDVGGHPNWSGMWSGIFLDCGISRGFCKTSTPRGGTHNRGFSPVSRQKTGKRGCFLSARVQHRVQATLSGPLAGSTPTPAAVVSVLPHNEKVEQLAANRLTIPQDAIASLLQRLVRHSVLAG